MGGAGDDVWGVGVWGGAPVSLLLKLRCELFYSTDFHELTFSLDFHDILPI